MTNIFNEMAWLHEPMWRIDSGSLIVRTQHDSDFWQRTHYGFRRDNGHALLKEVSGNAAIRARFKFDPIAQYDQCGILIRVDEDNWFKCSIEYENENDSRLGSVLTRDGYSDWATQDISSKVKDLWYEVEIKNSDITAKFSHDSIDFHQMRICRLNVGDRKLYVGIYGCSPIGSGFDFTVSNLTIAALV
jgi:uncharacterized protein